jgi:DNA-binding MarR family transcriptional regulator
LKIAASLEEALTVLRQSVVDDFALRRALGSKERSDLSYAGRLLLMQLSIDGPASAAELIALTAQPRSTVYSALATLRGGGLAARIAPYSEIRVELTRAGRNAVERLWPDGLLVTRRTQVFSLRRALIRDGLGEAQLDVAQLAVWLLGHPGVTQGELASILGLSRTDVSAALRRLRNGGFVKPITRDVDARRTWWLTPVGVDSVANRMLSLTMQHTHYRLESSATQVTLS